MMNTFSCSRFVFHLWVLVNLHTPESHLKITKSESLEVLKISGNPYTNQTPRLFLSCTSMRTIRRSHSRDLNQQSWVRKIYFQFQLHMHTMTTIFVKQNTELSGLGNTIHNKVQLLEIGSQKYNSRCMFNKTQ